MRTCPPSANRVFLDTAVAFSCCFGVVLTWLAVVFFLAFFLAAFVFREETWVFCVLADRCFEADGFVFFVAADFFRDGLPFFLAGFFVVVFFLAAFFFAVFFLAVCLVADLVFFFFFDGELAPALPAEVKTFF